MLMFNPSNGSTGLYKPINLNDFCEPPQPHHRVFKNVMTIFLRVESWLAASLITFTPPFS
jgi:hypothetical protein